MEPDLLNQGYYFCKIFDQQAIGKLLMKKRGYRTQNEVGDALSITGGAIRHFESGRKIPCVVVMMRFAEYFNSTVQELFLDHTIVLYLSEEQLEGEYSRWMSCLS
jgi:transcriptional regulator with XRE-family HTH domain